MKVTDSKVTRLEDASFKAFKQTERAKADAHAAHVVSPDVEQESLAGTQVNPSPISIPNRATVREPAIRPRA